MSPRLQAATFAVGVGLVAVLVAHVGPGAIAADLARVGWVFVPVLALFGVIYAASAAAWQLTLAGEPARPGFGRLFALTLSGFALNCVTPVVNAGGEPFKAAGLAQWTGWRRATGSVVLSKLLHATAHVLTWLTALALGLLLVPLPSRLRLAGWVALAVLALLGAALLAGHRNGILEWGLDLLARVPGLRGVARRLEPRRPALAELDRQVADFYATSPGRFWQALGLEYAARALWSAEYWIIAAGLGVGLSPLEAFVIGGVISLAQNLTFFVPFEAGSKEGIHYAVFDLFHLDPGVGLSVALISRLRDLAWIATGLVLVWAARRRALG